MKPTKPKKRYESERQIVDRIDKLKKRVTDKRKRAESDDAEADDLFRAEDKTKGNIKRKSAEMLRARADILEGQAETLGRKLAEFRTQPFAFVEDKSVAR